MCCKVLTVFKSSYYNHIHSCTLTIREKERKEEILRKVVLNVIEENPAYGYRRLIPELKKQGIVVNHKRLLPLLTKWGISLRRRIVRKTQSGIESILIALGSNVNVVKRLSEKEQAILGRIVFTDFTEIVYNKGKNKIYLVPYLENVTKKIIGYAVGRSPKTEVVLQAFNKAVFTLKRWGIDNTRTFYHQDQGSVFKSYAYVSAIVQNIKAHISYSRVGKPQDNPEIEAFFGRFKDEWKKVFYEAETEEEIIRLISKAISYYNTKRIHSNHKDKSPNEFLRELLKI